MLSRGEPIKSASFNQTAGMNKKSPPPAPADDRPVDASSMEQLIGYRLRRAQLYVFQQFNHHFAELELRPAEYSVLSLVANNPGRTQSQIAESLGIKRANFVPLINRLEERGLTVRRQQPDDRRSHALFLTKKGEALVAKADQVQSDFETHCIDRLGGSEARDQLLELLERLGG